MSLLPLGVALLGAPRVRADEPPRPEAECGHASQQPCEPEVSGTDDPPVDERPSKAPAERAKAAPEETKTKSAEKSAASRPLGEGEERPLPDYDGRGEPDRDFGDVAIWVPRVVLSPLYFVSEFVVRRPLGLLATTAEENNWPALLIDFFTFGPDEGSGILPTALIDFNLRPSVGLYFFSNDFLVDGNDLRLRGSWGGSSWWLGEIADRIHLGSEERLLFAFQYQMRPDWIYGGSGPVTDYDHRARFGKTRFGGRITYDTLLPRTSAFESEVSLYRVSLDGSESCCDDPSVNARVQAGSFATPPGMNDAFTLVREAVTLTLDSRLRRVPAGADEGSDYVSPPGSGLRLSLRGGHVSSLTSERSDPDAPSYQSWVEYGSTVGGFVDITGQQRVLGLQLVTQFVDPLSNDTQVPISEQVKLGGEFVMRGGLEGRLVGPSGAVARLTYTWPIWVWLDGDLFYEVGNAFDERLKDFGFRLLRSSFGLGFRTNGRRDHSFETLLAFMSNTFADGATVDSVRFVFGTTSGF